MQQLNQKVTVGLIQRAIDTPDLAHTSRNQNLQATIRDIREAAERGARIICTQELFLAPYFCLEERTECFDLAEPIPGDTTAQLCRLASELQVVIIASLFEKRMAGVYHNTAAVIDADGTLLGIYRKMHIPDDPGYYEKFYFTPGDLGYHIWDTRYGRIAVLICWDQWFPEAARAAALRGAQILFYPTAIGWHDQERDALGEAQFDAWHAVQRGHAVANGMYVCAVNRVGREGELTFWGRSFIFDPFGRELYRAGEVPEIIVHELDLHAIEETRRIWPFLRDRRIDSYAELQQRAID